MCDCTAPQGVVYKGREDLTEDNYLSEVIDDPPPPPPPSLLPLPFPAMLYFCCDPSADAPGSENVNGAQPGQVAADTDKRTLEEAMDGADVFLGSLLFNGLCQTFFKEISGRCCPSLPPSWLTSGFVPPPPPPPPPHTHTHTHTNTHQPKGLSAGNLMKPSMLMSMRRDRIVFALANPVCQQKALFCECFLLCVAMCDGKLLPLARKLESAPGLMLLFFCLVFLAMFPGQVPEIDYDLARETRPDGIMATGRSDLPNQINNGALSFLPPKDR